MDIYNKIEFVKKISIDINELNSVRNIEDILYIKLKTLENKCCEYGYIKENSIKILKVSSGFLNPTIFVPFIEYKLLCSAEVFLPNINDVYLVDVLSINKIGIMCCIRYTYNNKIVIPIRIIISKHNQDINLIKNVKKNDKIYVKLLGLKFSKNSSHIDSIANIVSEDYIFELKKMKLMIEELSYITHDCNINIDKIKKYKNILKFILKKENINYSELFVYHFIVEKKITLNNTDFVDHFNYYIKNFNNKNDEKVNTIINDDLSVEIDNETNFETNPEDETNPDLEDHTDYINFEDAEEEIDDDDNNEIDDEDDEDDEDDDDDDDDKDEMEDNELENKKKKIVKIKINKK